MKFVQLRELLLQRCHTGVGGAQFAGDFTELAIAHHGDGRVVIDIVQRFECLGAAAFHHHGDGHGQGDGEENAHAFENVGVAAGHGAGDVDAQGDGRSDHKHDKHRVSGRLPVGRGHMFLSRLVDTTH
ncbi:hypothetical protein [Bifidobacterium longum]|uniref:hypothetical protein n=1 Tax=Bifidobacterium longum TaxID=216816 RepID=UPI00080B3341|nr:hypothetical protein [Bifidobacterium longum]